MSFITNLYYKMVGHFMFETNRVQQVKSEPQEKIIFTTAMLYDIRKENQPCSGC